MASKQEFAKFMGVLSRAIPRFAPNLEDPLLIEAWFGELGRLDIGTLGFVYKLAVTKFDQFPSIRQILELAGATETSEEDKAREVAERIWGTIETKGSQFFDLKERLGPIGAEVVRMAGGWRAICDIATYDNAGTLKAQWREMAEVLIRKNASGRGLDELPQFGPVSDMIKQLADKYEM